MVTPADIERMFDVLDEHVTAPLAERKNLETFYQQLREAWSGPTPPELPVQEQWWLRFIELVQRFPRLRSLHFAADYLTLMQAATRFNAADLVRAEFQKHLDEISR